MIRACGCVAAVSCRSSACLVRGPGLRWPCPVYPPDRAGPARSRVTGVRCAAGPGGRCMGWAGPAVVGCGRHERPWRWPRNAAWTACGRARPEDAFRVGFCGLGEDVHGAVGGRAGGSSAGRGGRARDFTGVPPSLAGTVWCGGRVRRPGVWGGVVRWWVVPAGDRGRGRAGGVRGGFHRGVMELTHATVDDLPARLGRGGGHLDLPAGLDPQAPTGLLAGRFEHSAHPGPGRL